MAWNTSFTEFKSTLLAGIDCGTGGNVIKGIRGAADPTKRYAEFLAPYALSQGKCVNMIRVYAGERVIGARLTAANQGTGVTVVNVGDPYACGRFIASVPLPQLGITVASTQGFDCGVMTKTGRNGDGCGIGYLYTCETDVAITVAYGVADGNVGGWVGGAGGVGGLYGAALASGATLTLQLDILPA